MHHRIALRSIDDNDESLLFRVFCSVREDRFAALGLPAPQLEQLLSGQFKTQQSQYRSEFPAANFDLVVLDGKPIGNLYALHGPDAFFLIDVALLPQNRNSGIGAYLVRQLIAEARQASQPLRAQVLKGNPAWRLWQRLGFREVSDDGVYLGIEVPVAE